MADAETPTTRGERAPQREAATDAPLLSRLNARGFRLVQAADVAALVAIFVGTMLVREGWPWPTAPMTMYGLSLLVVVTIFAASLYFGGLYEREPRLGRPSVLPRAARQTLAAGGLVALLNLFLTSLAQSAGIDTERALPLPNPVLVSLIGLGAVAVAVNRRVSNRLRTRREGPPRVLLVGTPEDLAVAAAHLDTDADRARVVGAVSDPDGLFAAVQRLGATDVVLLSSGWLDSLYPDELIALDAVGVAVLQRVTAKETLFGIERVRQIGGLPFVLLRPQTLPMSRTRFKRFTDLVFLALLSPVLVPLLALVALYQVLLVRRPLLFWQDRVGAGGVVFRMCKFRTMYPDAEEDGRPRLAARSDPRIIPACRWLRATRLDELPQVYNILRGQMSLVGPRPERPALTAAFEAQFPAYARRHEVPPGLTGLAQIHGRYHTDPEYKLGYDLQYLVNWSPVLDLEILARTVWVVVSRRI